MKSVFKIMLIGSAILPGIMFADDIMCTMDYKPVCASVQVQCIKAPCDPIQQTFGNSCMMNSNKNATYLHEGECGSTQLNGSSWSLQSFDDKVATGAILSFFEGSFNANICNTINGSYGVQGNKFLVGPMTSTKMACIGEIGTYESAFNLSGATYELSTEGGKHMMITTAVGHKFQWQKKEENNIIGMPNPASVNCGKLGGTLEIKTAKDGSQYGICNFSNGKSCEEWALFRGECSAGIETGSTLDNVKKQKIWKTLDTYFQNKKINTQLKKISIMIQLNKLLNDMSLNANTSKKNIIQMLISSINEKNLAAMENYIKENISTLAVINSKDVSTKSIIWNGNLATVTYSVGTGTKSLTVDFSTGLSTPLVKKLNK